jgi:hypothetical protein
MKVHRKTRHADDDRCAEFDLDPAVVEVIARGLSKYAMAARALGLKVFGGSGHGELRVFNKGANGAVADLDGQFDGGDGCDTYG